MLLLIIRFYPKKVVFGGRLDTCCNTLTSCREVTFSPFVNVSSGPRHCSIHLGFGNVDLCILISFRDCSTLRWFELKVETLWDIIVTLGVPGEGEGLRRP